MKRLRRLSGERPVILAFERGAFPSCRVPILESDLCAMFQMPEETSYDFAERIVARVRRFGVGRVRQLELVFGDAVSGEAGSPVWFAERFVLIDTLRAALAQERLTLRLRFPPELQDLDAPAQLLGALGARDFPDRAGVDGVGCDANGESLRFELTFGFDQAGVVLPAEESPQPRKSDTDNWVPRGAFHDVWAASLP